jgi:hypothetical protein
MTCGKQTMGEKVEHYLWKDSAIYSDLMVATVMKNWPAA